MTDINFGEEAVFEVLLFISSNSAPGADGMQANIFINCAAELAYPLSLLFSHIMFEEGLIHPSLKKGQLFLFSREGIDLPMEIIVLFL